MNNLIRIWKNRNQITEGIRNRVFKTEHVELIAAERMRICTGCRLYTTTSGCAVPGTQPCCNEDLGGCGCSLALKTRSLSSACPKGYWKEELSESEENLLLANLSEPNESKED